VLTDIYSKTSRQVQDTGGFRWEANDPGCPVFHRPGPGAATLPFVHGGTGSHGDSDGFGAPARVAVEVMEFTGGYCRLALHDAADGRVLDAVTMREEGGRGPAYLDPSGSSRVCLEEPGCPVRLSAG
jgi:hypothetical protein